MAAFTIFLIFVASYAVFMLGAYLLAKVFFPLEKNDLQSSPPPSMRRVRKHYMIPTRV